MKELIASLESLAKQMFLQKRKHYTFTGEASYTREEAYTCWICEMEFGDKEQVLTWSLSLYQQVLGVGASIEKRLTICK